MALAALSVAATGLSTTAAAQSSAAPVAGWQDGFFLQSPDGEYRLAIGALGQFDGRFALDDPSVVTNTFAVRRFRPTLSGRLTRLFDFKVMPELAGGGATVLDAYLDVRVASWMRIRTGKDKVPVGYEWLTGDAFLLFPERSLATTLVPNRDVGVQAIGEAVGGRVVYGVGVFNGVPDGATADSDSNAGKDLAGRFVVQPWRGSDAPAGLRGLGFHLGWSTGREDGTVPTYRSSLGQTIFTYETGTAERGRRVHVAPTAFLYDGPVGLFAEFVRSSHEVARRADTLSTTVAHHGWNLTASVVTTGEDASDRGVRPSANFDPRRGSWGAFQILMRYSAVSFDDRAFSAQLASSTSSQSARAFGVGANWYANPFIKYYVMFERTAFEGGSSAKPAEHALQIRAQLAF